MSIREILDAVSTGGTLGFAILFLYGFVSGKIHSDTELRERLREKDAQIARLLRQKK